MLPRIGITIAPYPEYEGQKIRNAYCEKILAGGGLPLLLPSIHPLYAPELSSVIDGLLISGGGDYPPQICGLPGYESPTDRDTMELALLKLAWNAKLPTLGVCRGMQGMNVALGGTLKNLPASGEALHQQQAPRQETVHSVELMGDLARRYGRDRLQVNSFHHQAVEKLAAPLCLFARSEDGCIEAIGAKEFFFLGLQWHPEHLTDPLPFAALIEATGTRL